ncbi:MAG: glycerol kinase GlpK [Prolixibacteraceae bacterium]|nr:glycerol kinase GlpK [Prolixibacteraceae bacterium]
MSSIRKYILTIDQSTSATKSILFNFRGKLVDRVTIPHQQFYPSHGFVEHDPLEIFNNTLRGIEQLISKTQIIPEELAGIAITNQRETAMIWDKTSGKPVSNAAVWQCLRGGDFCKKLKSEGYSAQIAKKTGLIIDPYFSASKLKWIMDNTPDLKAKALKGELLLGTMDSWLLWKLTNGRVHATDYSNACRTMLFNIHKLEWDKELIDLFGLHESMLPKVKFSDEVFGYTDPSTAIGLELPVAGLTGDSHGALFGQNCFELGSGKVTYGTGSSIMMNIGKKPLAPPEGLVTSIGFACNQQIDYVFEGNIHCTGDTLNWLRNDIGIISDNAEIEPLASSVENNNGVYLVPAFVGLGAPYWDNQARASISGMPRNTKKAHIVRAALESIAYQVKDVVGPMSETGGTGLKQLNVDGGPTRNNFLMQFQADMIRCEIVRSNIEEVSALGATFLAGLAFNVWKDKAEIKSLKNTEQTFTPQKVQSEVDELYKGWKKAVERTRMK